MKICRKRGIVLRVCYDGDMKSGNGFAGIAVLVVLAVLALGGAGYYYAQKRAATKTQGGPFAATSTTETPGAAGEQSGEYLGFIKSIAKQDGKYSLTIDYATLLTGKAAVEAAIKSGSCPTQDYLGLSREQALSELKNADLSRELGKWGQCAPNDYYIQNLNPKLRTFGIAPDAEVKMATWVWPSSEESMYTLYGIFSGRITESPQGNDAGIWKKLPYWITLRNGAVKEIREQYIP